jgi:drug/metabolite transporter (DMT)-like permease
VLIASFAVFRTEVTLRATLGIFISFLGIILVIQGDGEGWALSSQTFQGDLLIIGAAIVWALFTVLAKPLLKEYSSLKVTTYVMLLSTIFFLPYLPNEKGGGWWEISGLAWFSVLYVAILGNGLAYFFWVVGIQRIGPLRTILYQYLMPVTAIFCSVPFLFCSAFGIYGNPETFRLSQASIDKKRVLPWPEAITLPAPPEARKSL